MSLELAITLPIVLVAGLLYAAFLMCEECNETGKAGPYHSELLNPFNHFGSYGYIPIVIVNILFVSFEAFFLINLALTDYQDGCLNFFLVYLVHTFVSLVLISYLCISSIKRTNESPKYENNYYGNVVSVAPAEPDIFASKGIDSEYILRAFYILYLPIMAFVTFFPELEECNSLTDRYSYGALSLATLAAANWMYSMRSQVLVLDYTNPGMTVWKDTLNWNTIWLAPVFGTIISFIISLSEEEDNETTLRAIKFAILALSAIIAKLQAYTVLISSFNTIISGYVALYQVDSRNQYMHSKKRYLEL